MVHSTLWVICHNVKKRKEARRLSTDILSAKWGLFLQICVFSGFSTIEIHYLCNKINMWLGAMAHAYNLSTLGG